MSLYASIDLPQAQKKAVTRPDGFVGLYADPSVITETHSEIQQHDLSNEDASISHAVLQFAPSRKRHNLPLQRKAGVAASNESLSGHSTNARSFAAESADSHIEAGTECTTRTQHIPRLEIINNFDDYADYVPETGEHSGRQTLEIVRKKHKKSKQNFALQQPLSWDDEYEPVRPIDLDDYLRSDEREDARKDWKAKKQALGPSAGGYNRETHLPRSVVSQFEQSNVPSFVSSRTQNTGKRRLNFAPAISSAVHLVSTSHTPSQEVSFRLSTSPSQSHMDDQYVQPPPPPPPTLPYPQTAEEAYLRRGTMAHVGPLDEHANSAQSRASAVPQPHGSPAGLTYATTSAVQHPSVYTTSAVVPRVEYSALPTNPRDNAMSCERPLSMQSPNSEPQNTDTLPSRGSAPGQKGFAQRYMAAQGWSKGQGLGSSGSGRLAPLFVKPQKDGKIGKIIDKHARDNREQVKMSRVVLIEGMIRVDEVYDEHLQQDIGESCAAAYGKVERVKIVTDLGRVLVKFTDTISALRCTSTVEGRIYAGKSISARYYSEDDFEHGDWTK